MKNPRIFIFIIIIFCSCPGILCFSPAFTKRTCQSHRRTTPPPTSGVVVIPRQQQMALSLKNNNNSNNDEDDTISRTNELLKTAARLRKEAEVLEQSMRSRNISSSSAAGGGGGGGKTKQGTDVDLSTIVAADQQEDTLPSNNSMKNKFYTSLKDSTWMISYRFASDAVNRDNSNDNDSSSPKPTFYSGKVKVTFQGDGYTTMLETSLPPPPSQDSTHDAAAKINSSSNVLNFQKFWGWDEETSRDDGMQYILFSADVLLPESDPNYSKTMAKQRFYFQCRVNKDPKTGEISMSDGTVTIKKDIEPPGGFWGVFNGGGILAQFRYCGNFLMKPWSK